MSVDFAKFRHFIRIGVYKQEFGSNHGGGNDLLSPPKRSDLHFVFGSPPSNVVASPGAGAPSFPGDGARSLPGAGALPFPGDGAHPRLVPAAQHVSSSSAAAAIPQNQSSLQQVNIPPPIVGFPNSVPLPMPSLEQLSSMLRSKGVNSKPWEIAESIRPKPETDDFVPGFQRITMFALIEQARLKAASRRARGESVTHIQKDVI
jgi:hypothetical protein